MQASAEDRNSRVAIELLPKLFRKLWKRCQNRQFIYARRPFRRHGVDHVAQAAHGLHHIDAELLAQASDEDFDRVRIAIEILVVKMLDDLAARDDPPAMVHQIGEQPIFMRGQLYRLAVDRHAPGFGVEPHRPALQFVGGVARRAAQQGAQPRQHLLHDGKALPHNRRRRRRILAPSRSSGRARSGSAPACPVPPCARRSARKCRPSWAGLCRAPPRHRVRSRRENGPSSPSNAESTA